MEIKNVLNNGLNIYSYLNKNNHSFCLSLYVKSGSIYESKENNGITHLLEHLIIRNINKIYGNKLYKDLDRNGLSFNACTYKEFVRFYITGSSSKYLNAVEILTKVFDPIILTRQEINTELYRIKAEISESKLDNSFDKFTDSYIWEGSGASQTITGMISSLRKISISKLNNYKNQILSRDNIFIYLTGNISSSFVNKSLDLLGNIKLLNVIKNENRVTIPDNFGNRIEKVRSKSSDSYRIKFCFDISYNEKDDNKYSLLYDLLFDRESCDFFQKLSEDKGIIYSYNAYIERYSNAAILSFSYDISYSNFYDSISQCIDIINNFLFSVENELEFVLPRYTLNTNFLYDDPDDLNWTLSYENHILNCGYKTLEERIDLYKFITIDEIKTIAKNIFNLNNLSIYYEGLSNKIDNNKILQLISKLQVK